MHCISVHLQKRKLFLRPEVINAICDCIVNVLQGKFPVSNRLENHIITNNKLINSSTQKGCMEKISGCWEHMSMVWNELKSSKAEHGNLAAVWLDIANAYGSVPHQLIFFALQRYGVPEHWINLIRNYYKGLWRASVNLLLLLQVGTTTLEVFSIILFLSAINVVIE